MARCSSAMPLSRLDRWTTVQYAPKPAFETDFWKDAAARKSWVDVEIRNQRGDTIATGEAIMEFPLP